MQKWYLGSSLQRKFLLTSTPFLEKDNNTGNNYKSGALNKIMKGSIFTKQPRQKQKVLSRGLRLRWLSLKTVFMSKIVPCGVVSKVMEGRKCTD